MQPKKLDFIDALRGFAAIYVLLYHFSLITNPMAVAPRWLAPFTGLGGSGVTLFFVVSAFTLCLSMDARSRDEKNPLSNYFLRRFFRIAPLFYFWIVAYCVRDKLVFDVSHPLGEIARSVFFVLNLFPGHEQGFVWASWTLGVEMLFYLLFPIVFWYGGNLGRAGALFVCALLLRSGWHAALPLIVKDPAVAPIFYNFSLLHHLPTFVFGIVVYRTYRLLNMGKAKELGLGHLLIAIFGVVLISISYGLVDVGPIDGITVQAVIFGLLLLGLSVTAPKLLVNRVTCFFGKISYSVYLSHATTLYFMSKVFASIYTQVPYVTIAYFLSLAAGVAVVALLSYLTYRYVETPGNAVGRAIIKYWAARVAGRAA
ncbi:peptidoglycan/LPS O-acetylase OafA/YrhL [Paraburkholderia sp. BL6669N2]|uniref:acyltransferase family protein n=1 Tax=Paraburkholderia sp. BL6669N2 TaxID=1938807 RepID=UPI000E23DFF7|nr:acyltransferase [Paraburkholderia sp. BL6669N2]REG61256.1 peptidoglycan/LPS O-acetylase OafA/YrhL [Paraburkholderia sp. BL6669N2]